MPWDTFEDDDDNDDADEEEDGAESFRRAASSFLLATGFASQDMQAFHGLGFDLAQEERELDEDGNVVPNQAS